jgi:quercetin dioxygenase-like cupin family protein
MAIRVLHVDEDYVETPLVEGGQPARIVAWPGTGATLGSLHYVEYDVGLSSIPHDHPASQELMYVIEGVGSIADMSGGNGREDVHEIRPGSVVIVDPGTVHQVRATTRLVNVGGPCPADLFFYRRAGLMSW